MYYSNPIMKIEKRGQVGRRIITLLICVLIMTAVAEASDSLYVKYKEMADSMFRAEQYDSSLIIAQKARDEAVRLYGEEDTLFARALHLMARCYINISDTSEAENLWRASLTIWEKLGGPDHNEVARCLKGLAVIAYERKEYAVSDSLITRAIRIWENLQGEERLELARAINELANIKLMTGDYPNAENLYSRALNETEMAVGMRHESYMRILNNLGLVSMWQGKYHQALDYLQRAVSLTEEVFGSSRWPLHSMLSNISIIHMRFQEYDKAIECCQRAIGIIEKARGSDSPQLSVKLHTLAVAYRRLGRLKEAEQAALRCLEIRRKHYPDEQLLLAAASAILARIYYDVGDSTAFGESYEQALSAYREALASQSYSMDFPRQLETFSWHFRHYDPLTCLELARHAFELRRNFLIVNCRAMSERGALKYAQFMRLAAANYLSSYMELMSPESRIKMDAADIIIASKGQVSDEIFDRNLSLIEETDPDIATLRDSLSVVKVGLSSLHASGKLDDPKEAYGTEGDSLLIEKVRLESELIRRTSDDPRSREAQLITAERVASNLPEGSSLVEYMRYQYSRRNPDLDNINYLVLILKPDKTEPVILDLGPAAQIDSVVSLYHDHMKLSAGGDKPSDESDREYRQIASFLYSILWQPIEHEIEDYDFVFIAPDGDLNLVSFSSLLDNNGHYVAEKIPIHYLSSGRDVIWLNRSQDIGSGMIALGDPDYDAQAADRRGQEYSYARAEDIASPTVYGPHQGIRRNVRSECPQLDEITVDRLPATRGEIEQAIGFWRQNYPDTAIGLLDNNASEDNLKRLAPGARVIHIATHGFYSPHSCREQETVFNPDNIFRYLHGLYEPNPLLQSGLFLAGSNLHGEMADSLGVDDGILTAEEVSLLNLTGVEWVVLSACESGLGEVEAGEGVYGLRRAFQMAGARTVISSLWPVADRGTAEFMISLYMASDQPLYEKIHEYQKAQIEKLRNHGYSDHPCQWAAFIAAGNWR